MPGSKKANMPSEKRLLKVHALLERYAPDYYRQPCRPVLVSYKGQIYNTVHTSPGHWAIWRAKVIALPEKPPEEGRTPTVGHYECVLCGHTITTIARPWDG